MNLLPPPLPPNAPEAPPLVTGAAVELRAARREYPRGNATVVALDDVSLRVPAGHLVAIRGRSGAGKTTLLNVMGGLDRATAGHVQLGETVIELDDGRVVPPGPRPSHPRRRRLTACRRRRARVASPVTS